MRKNEGRRRGKEERICKLEWVNLHSSFSFSFTPSHFLCLYLPDYLLSLSSFSLTSQFHAQDHLQTRWHTTHQTNTHSDIQENVGPAVIFFQIFKFGSYCFILDVKTFESGRFVTWKPIGEWGAFIKWWQWSPTCPAKVITKYLKVTHQWRLNLRVELLALKSLRSK